MLPGIVYTILFVVSMYYFSKTANNFTEWLTIKVGLKNWLDKMQSSFLGFFFTLGGMVLWMIQMLLYFSLFKYLFLIIGSPIFAYLSEKTEAIIEGKEYPFIVFDKRTNQYAGSTRFYDIQPDYKTLQLGYTWYGLNFQGTGLNKQCKFLLLSFAFEQLGQERVEFRADNRNERSIAAMKSIGCKVDGILRSNMPNRDESRRDSIVLSILRNEWFDEVKDALRQKIMTL